MSLLHRLAGSLVGRREVAVLFDEHELKLVPFALCAQDPITLQFLEQRPADVEEVGSPEIVQIGIAENAAQLVARALWDPRGHDHRADIFHLRLVVSEAWQVLANDGATGFLVVQVLVDETRIVKKRCGPQQVELLPSDTLGVRDGDSGLIDIQRVRERMIGALQRQLIFELGENEDFGSALVHGL